MVLHSRIFALHYKNCLLESLRICYDNMSMQYAAILKGCENDNFQLKKFDIFLIFAKNIDCGCLTEVGLKSTHNLCFRAKIRKKKCIPR